MSYEAVGDKAGDILVSGLNLARGNTGGSNYALPAPAPEPTTAPTPAPAAPSLLDKFVSGLSSAVAKLSTPEAKAAAAKFTADQNARAKAAQRATLQKSAAARAAAANKIPTLALVAGVGVVGYLVYEYTKGKR